MDFIGAIPKSIHLRRRRARTAKNCDIGPDWRYHWTVVSFLERLRRRIDLLPGTDRAGTVARIRVGVPFSPENIWLLVASCILASIGLDTNSEAVLIGAMLISPLMSPILAVGLSMATRDRPLLILSLRELGFGTLCSVLLSAAYFLLTPLGQATPQLTERTVPTLLDVGVALFGGTAGIVAGSRRTLGLALPGVAIATALMPPLCTVGFGLATGQPRYFIGAFYLFFLNAVFISFATFLVVRTLRFPHVAPPDELTRRQSRRLVWGIAGLTLIPSIFLMLYVGAEGRLRREARQFINTEVSSDAVAVVDWSLTWPDPKPFDLLLGRLTDNDRRALLKIYYAGDRDAGVFSDSLRKRMAAYRMARVDLSLRQVGVSAQETLKLQRVAEKSSEAAITVMRAELHRLEARVDDLAAARADSGPGTK